MCYLNILVDDDNVKDSNDPEELSEEAICKSTYGRVDHTNYPAIVELYKDPSTEIEVVFLCVCLPGGATNIKIDLNEDGTSVIIKYKWPALKYKEEKMFKKDCTDAKDKLESYHPKVVAFKNGLEKIRTNIDVAPESSMSINLPIPVQTSTWTKRGLKEENGTLVLRAEFKGHTPVYCKKVCDMNVDFEL